MVAPLAVMAGFTLKDVRVYRPYPDEIPWELLDEGAPFEADVDLVRVAKLHGQAVGVYAIRPRSPICYELTHLAVAPAYRRRGLGRWLLGHAIGIAESKGGREIRTRRNPSGHLFARAGFVVEGEVLVLRLSPE